MKIQRAQQPITYVSQFFSLNVRPVPGQAYIHFQTHGSVVNTRDLPLTLSILKKRFPDVLQSECFNDDNLPFISEVIQTETGHLFEHILIQYLEELKTQSALAHDSISGRTDWNWKRDAFGTFHIVITPVNMYEPAFTEALSQSIILLEEIMSSVKNTALHIF